MKKEGWGGGGTRLLSFGPGSGDFPLLKPSGKNLNITIGPGLPKDTRKCSFQKGLASNLQSFYTIGFLIMFILTGIDGPSKLTCPK